MFYRLKVSNLKSKMRLSDLNMESGNKNDMFIRYPFNPGNLYVIVFHSTSEIFFILPVHVCVPIKLIPKFYFIVLSLLLYMLKYGYG